MLITEHTVHKDSNNPNNAPTKTPINIPLILLASGADLYIMGQSFTGKDLLPQIYYHNKRLRE